MTKTRSQFVFLLAVFLLAATANFFVFSALAEETETPGPIAGIEQRPLWTTSRVLGSPEPPPPYTAERIYPNLTFKGPVHLILGPHHKRFYLTQYTGNILSFDTDLETSETAPFLELKMNVFSIEFHPQFEENPYVYVFGNTAPQVKTGEDKHNQILRFNVVGDDVLTADPDSKLVILEYTSNGHNGGEAKFGPDGYLYITGGDGTSDSDGWNTGQDVSDLPASMMRIDVDHPEEGRNYGIPEDNPFVELEDARDEIWAYGFRNPWRFNIDFTTGNIYVGDVGQDLWEMIQLVRPGDNYGWSVKEGNSDFHPLKKRGPTPIVPPLVEHHHTESRSITGGYVYRGPQMPELEGVYIYGDYETGKIWGLRHEDRQVTWHEELSDLSLKVSSFAVGVNQEFILLDYQNGELYQLVPAPQDEDLPPFPQKLSETGIYTDTANLVPDPGLIPYSVNSPQWNDNALVRRYIGLPDDGKITFSAGGAWTFPEASVLVKEIAYPSAPEKKSTRRVETQILTFQRGQWAGYTYVWNDDQTDADLAPAGGADLSLLVDDPNNPGQQRELAYHISSHSECMFCHSRAAGFSLGMQTPQLNRAHDYALGSDNQLDTLNHLGVFTEPLKQKPADLTRLADPYNPADDINDRARSYLHANCSHCHVGAGGGNAQILLTQQTKLADTLLVGGRPLHANFGIAGAMIVAPGDPDRSVLLKRISRRGIGQMPPLSTTHVDHTAVKLIRDWIQQIEIPTEAQDNVDRAFALVHGESGALSRWYTSGSLASNPSAEHLAQASTPPEEDYPEDTNPQNPSSNTKKAEADTELQTKQKQPELFTWLPAIGTGTDCQVTLVRSSSTTDKVWLAKTDIILSESCDIQLTTDSNVSLELWLNGKRLSRLPGTGIESDRYDANLHKGRNRLLVALNSNDDSNPTYHVNFRRKSANPKHEQYTLAALANQGDARHGKQLFLDVKKTQCATCHRIDDQGGEVGPNLTGIGSRLSPTRIIESILDPSRTVAPNYRAVLIELASGRLLTGINVAETPDSVTIKDQQGQQLVISKTEIETLQIQPTSLMPAKLDELITQQEFVDLVTYLTQQTSSD